MRGEILRYDEVDGLGFITGADGERYMFERADLRRAASPASGTPVEFEANGSRAERILLLRAAAASVPAVARAAPRWAATGSRAKAERISGPVSAGR